MARGTYAPVTPRPAMCNMVSSASIASSREASGRCSAHPRPPGGSPMPYRVARAPAHWRRRQAHGRCRLIALRVAGVSSEYIEEMRCLSPLCLTATSVRRDRRNTSGCQPPAIEADSRADLDAYWGRDCAVRDLANAIYKNLLPRSIRCHAGRDPAFGIAGRRRLYEPVGKELIRLRVRRRGRHSLRALKYRKEKLFVLSCYAPFLLCVPFVLAIQSRRPRRLRRMVCIAEGDRVHSTSRAQQSNWGHTHAARTVSRTEAEMNSAARRRYTLRLQPRRRHDDFTGTFRMARRRRFVHASPNTSPRFNPGREG